MKPWQKVLSAIVSIIIALFTSLFIEKMGYGDHLQHYYFGGLTDMGQLEKFVGKSYFQGIKTVMAVVFVFFVAYISFFAFFFELIALTYFICTSKWRKPSVFISYKNMTGDGTVNTNKIALDIKTALEKKGFRILFFKYTDQLDHDSINFQIQMLLRKADAMIAIPDPYRPSYVNAEISSAVNSFKPVYIIRHTKDQKLPDTANSGHTVLLLDKLKKAKYEPLSYLLQYVHKLWHKRLFIIGLPLISFLYPFIYLDDDNGSSIKAILIFGLVTAGLVFFKAPILTVIIIIKIIITAVGAFGAYLTLNGIFENIRLRKIIRQSMINAGNTYDHFKSAGFEKKLLDCVDKVGLAK